MLTIDQQTGKPIKPVANIHPAWWRTALAGGIEGFLGHSRFSGAAEPFASTILNTDPGMNRAHALQSEFDIASREAQQERLNQTQQRLEEQARQRTDAYKNWHQGHTAIEQQKADEAALNDVQRQYGRPIGRMPPPTPPPSMIGAPATVNQPAPTGRFQPPAPQGTVPAPPTLTPGPTILPQGVRNAMQPPTPPSSSIEGWSPRTLRDPVSGERQQFQIPPAEEAARMKQETDQESWPEITNDMAKVLGGGLKPGQKVPQNRFDSYLKQYEALANPRPVPERRPLSVAPGHVVFDPDSGRPIYTAPPAPDKPPKPAGPATFRAVEVRKQAALQKAENQAARDLDVFGGAGMAPASEKQRVYSELEKKKQQIQSGYESEIEAAGGSAGESPAPARTPPPVPAAPIAAPPASNVPAARTAAGTGTSPGNPRTFPESRIPDVVRRAQAAGMNLTPEQAKKQLQSEGWTILQGQ